MQMPISGKKLLSLHTLHIEKTIREYEEYVNIFDKQHEQLTWKTQVKKSKKEIENICSVI